jgi:phosphoribosylformylglycinamidine synthase
VGRGSRPKAGLCGFTVSHLNLEEYPRPWELNYGKPDRIVTPRQIMTEGPLGAAAFNNEFGRPNLGGYFRTFEVETSEGVRGYHKPIMVAGGSVTSRLSTLISRHLMRVPSWWCWVVQPCLLA